ncbi:hypothetical protein ACFO1B_48815 [Dactylosporangium siamense]|nr:hypothetical protein [Dactylosporangium siamense]
MQFPTMPIVISPPVEVDGGCQTHGRSAARPAPSFAVVEAGGYR